jgi:hypothetical protein
LEGAFGDVDAGVYTAVDGALPSLTIEKIVGGTVNEQYMGMKIQELSMAAKARETLKMSVSLVGKQRFEIVSPTTRDYSVKNPFVFYQGTFKIDDVEVLIREFNITLNNNIKHPNHQSGDIYTQEQYEGIRDVTGSVLLDFKTLAMRNKFLNITEASVEYLFTNGSDSLKIEMPKVVFPSWSLEEDEQIYLQRVDFRGLRDGSDAAIKATLVSA